MGCSASVVACASNSSLEAVRPVQPPPSRVFSRFHLPLLKSHSTSSLSAADSDQDQDEDSDSDSDSASDSCSAAGSHRRSSFSLSSSFSVLLRSNSQSQPRAASKSGSLAAQGQGQNQDRRKNKPELAHNVQRRASLDSKPSKCSDWQSQSRLGCKCPNLHPAGLDCSCVHAPQVIVSDVRSDCRIKVKLPPIIQNAAHTMAAQSRSGCASVTQQLSSPGSGSSVAASTSASDPSFCSSGCSTPSARQSSNCKSIELNAISSAPGVDRPSSRSRKRLSPTPLASLDGCAMQKRINALLHKAGLTLPHVQQQYQSAGSLTQASATIPNRPAARLFGEASDELSKDAAERMTSQQTFEKSEGANADTLMQSQMLPPTPAAPQLNPQPSPTGSLPAPEVSLAFNLLTAALSYPPHVQQQIFSASFNPTGKANHEPSLSHTLALSHFQSNSCFDHQSPPPAAFVPVREQFALSPAQLDSCIAKADEVRQSFAASADVLSNQLAALRLHPRALKEGDWTEWNKEKVEVKYRRETRR